MNKKELYYLALRGFACGILLIAALRKFKQDDLGLMFYLDIIFLILFIGEIIYTVNNKTRK